MMEASIGGGLQLSSTTTLEEMMRWLEEEGEEVVVRQEKYEKDLEKLEVMEDVIIHSLGE